MFDVEFGSVPDRFAEGTQPFRTLCRKHPEIVAESERVLPFLASFPRQLLEFLIGRTQILEKEPLPLPVDFQSIDIILVGPFAAVRKYAQRTRSHALMFARFSKSGNKWQQRKRCHLLPKTNRGLDQVQ
jgi:hypothetical protein